MAVKELGSKRLKPSPVCLFCKRRKIKCDRKTPCSSCIKYCNPDCIYDEPSNSKRYRRTKFQIKNSLEHDGVNRENENTEGVNEDVNNLESKIADLQLQLTNLAKAFRLPDHDSSSMKPNESNSLDHLDSLNSKDPDDSFFDEPFVALLAKVEDENIDLFEGYSSLYSYHPFKKRNFGLFSWKSLLLIDPSLKLVWDFVHKKSRSQVSKIDDKTNKNDANNNFTNLLDNEVNDFKETINEATNKKPQNLDDVMNRVSYKAKVLGLTSLDKNIGAELELLSKIELVLPVKRATWCYIDKFFLKLYPFFPFLDVTDFKENIVRLIGTGEIDPGRTISIVIENKIDFAYLGILLIIVRLGYLTLFTAFDNNIETYLNSNDQSPHVMETKYLLDNPATIEVFEVAKECLDQFQLIGTINLTIFQLALYTKVYKTYSPEYGEGPDDGESQVFSAILFQLAYSLGLNRDPDKLPFAGDERENNLGRKIWYGLLMIDLDQSLESGDPLNANKFSFDTKLPYHKLGNSNLKDDKRDKMVQDCFQFLRSTYYPVVELLNSVLSFKSQSTISKICKQINFIKKEILGSNGLLNIFRDKSSTENEQIVNTFRYKLELQTSYFFCSLYFYLYNVLERKGNQKFAFYYLIRLFDKLLVVVFPFCVAFSKNRERLDARIDFVLMPGVELMIHKALLYLLSLIIRIKITIVNRKMTFNHSQKLAENQEYHENFVKLNRLQDLMTSLAQILLNTISRYSNRYYYSWVISRLQKYLLCIVESNSFEQTIYSRQMDFPLLNKNQYLDELIDIIEKSNMLFTSTDTELADDKKSDSYNSEVLNRSIFSPSEDLSSELNENVNLEYTSNSIPRLSHIPIVPEDRINHLDFPDNNGVPLLYENIDNSQDIDSLWLRLMSIKGKNNSEIENFDQLLSEQIENLNSFNQGMEGNDYVNSFIVDEIFKDLSR